eukprot:CAMPEP_0198734516 /NCGR_PEP_ID=MMETSP1475-20131203/53316_1 /TAXON_ID= ORGANISM="Unidentified sp., Strain CCMP1999" /NCGR_SAMPLE_ID=MMETSP1475 /ASSEMBLY_ACC=CAM_ASM_001111 /LENGTH=343 /DNA_ID=CAMNT_0044498007 /DNA_START=57 /DNA_END=1088 /DNA_ORIENTATION=+
MSFIAGGVACVGVSIGILFVSRPFCGKRLYTAPCKGDSNGRKYGVNSQSVRQVLVEGALPGQPSKEAIRDDLRSSPGVLKCLKGQQSAPEKAESCVEVTCKSQCEDSQDLYDRFDSEESVHTNGGPASFDMNDFLNLGSYTEAGDAGKLDIIQERQWGHAQMDTQHQDGTNNSGAKGSYDFLQHLVLDNIECDFEAESDTEFDNIDSTDSIDRRFTPVLVKQPSDENPDEIPSSRKFSGLICYTTLRMDANDTAEFVADPGNWAPSRHEPMLHTDVTKSALADRNRRNRETSSSVSFSPIVMVRTTAFRPEERSASYDAWRADQSQIVRGIFIHEDGAGQELA